MEGKYNNENSYKRPEHVPLKPTLALRPTYAATQ